MYLLGGSWDLARKVTSIGIGVTSTYRYSYFSYTPSLFSSTGKSAFLMRGNAVQVDVAFGFW